MTTIIVPTQTITICMSGSSTQLYDALEQHKLPTRAIVESIGAERQHSTVELPDTDEIRARVKELAVEYAFELLAISMTAVYPGARR